MMAALHRRQPADSTAPADEPLVHWVDMGDRLIAWDETAGAGWVDVDASALPHDWGGWTTCASDGAPWPRSPVGEVNP
ncbi:hypothetical protein DVS28_b0170 (plasmid) [Euzebya pacifica]|uniref:Uncharacterized protein n=1 Tax=Euzebya pacifica TaxID=1608957 RepID=A0A346Y643_9ACTN|nr:hypothetical protein [Euzebya pacifica]AXV09940.1 hypothetical protein DVS28_b0170 [Euzebya pacifica]